MLALAFLSLGCPPSAPAGLVMTDLRTTMSQDQLNVRIQDYGAGGASAPVASADAHVRLPTGLITKGRLAEPAGAGAGGLGLQTGQDRYGFLLMAGTASVTDRLVALTSTFVLPDRYTGGGAAAVMRPVFFVSPSLGVAYVLYQRAAAGAAASISYAVAPLTGGTVRALTASDPQLDGIDLARASPSVYDSVQMVLVRAADTRCARTLGLYYDRSGLYFRQADLGTERVDGRAQGVLAYSVRAGLGGCASCGAEIVATDLASGSVTVAAGFTTAQLHQQVYPMAITSITTEAERRLVTEMAATVVSVVASLALVALLIAAAVQLARVRFRRAKTTSAASELVVPGRVFVYHPERDRPVDVSKAVSKALSMDVSKAAIDMQRFAQRHPVHLLRHPGSLRLSECSGSPGMMHARSSQRKLLPEGGNSRYSPGNCRCSADHSRYSTGSGESSPAAERAARWSAAFGDGARPNLSRLRPTGDADAATLRCFWPRAASPNSRRTRLDSCESLASQAGDEDDPKQPLSPAHKSDDVV